MINTLYLPELREMLEVDDREGLAEFGAALHPARAAEFMEGLSTEETWRVLQASPDSKRTGIFGFLETAKQIEILESFDPALVSTIVAELPADDRVDLLSDVDSQVVGEIVPLLPKEDRHETLRLLEIPEGTAGSLMTTEVGKLPESLTVREALEEISRQAEDLETVYYNYIVDDENHLRGLISARQLVTHFRQPNKPIAEIMQRDVVTVRVDDDQEAVANTVAAYNFLAIPVVDDEQHLLGIITHDDIIDVLREEATEDAHLSVGVGPLEDSYLQVHWATLAWKRGMWLLILLVGAMFTILALESYNATLAQVTWLVFFIPLVISSGGNTGNQSATLVITALNNGDLSVYDWVRVVRREAVMGLCLGGMLGLLGFFGALAFSAMSFEPRPTPFQLLVIPITLMLVSMSGALVGGVLPLLFRRLGLDPALMSNPFVAGICDLTGIVIYMTVAIVLLGDVGL